MSDDDPKRKRRGIPAARSHLWVARRAAEKYLTEREKDQPNKHDLMLYYGSFFFFARSALYALGGSDGVESPELNNIQNTYFKTDIAGDPVFDLLTDERNRIGHGDDSWAFHPMMPLGMLDRFMTAGHDWSAAVFDEVWPDGVFRGETIDMVINKVWRQVSNWLDEIDRRDDMRVRKPMAD